MNDDFVKMRASNMREKKSNILRNFLNMMIVKIIIFF